MEIKIIQKFLKVKSSTVDDMKTLLEDVKICKNEKLEVEIKKLQEELKEVKKLKKYGLVWEEKIEKFDEDTVGKLPVLKEVKKYDIKNDDSESNILIEGDNYHTLSVLNYTHKGKIDVIYIDPPYNTGNNDFVYNDKFIDKEDKFRHSKWLSFMNKRLKLAKELLSEKGVIFISIDDNEFAQLKLLCDEHFGIESFIGSFIWNKKLTGGYDSKFLNIQHEYIFVISKNKEYLNINYDKVESKYKEIDEFGRK
ncbi:MAG: site-specific DNA-methyltransferase [Candidatus Gracilibacteria bacterium]|nr:site-specific DNA-methyltransferase [Candidatus Gracilibacteria bacterium]